MEDHKDFNPDDLLDRAVDAVLRRPIPDELPPDRVARLVAAVQQAANRPYPFTLIERIRNMKVRTKLALAVTILIVLVGLMSWLVPGSGAALAFADVAEALNNVHTATWKTTSVVEVTEPQKKTVTFSANAMFMAPSHERTETTADGAKSAAISIIDAQKDKAITLVPATKTATVINLKNFPPNDNPFGRTFQGLRELVANAQSGKAGKVERLGVKTIDGRTAEGFRIQLGSIDVKIWADPKTLLPIRAEETIADPKVSVIMADFRFNVPLDKSLFSVDIPPGYAVQQTAQIDASKPWAFLTGALKMAAECNDSVFPPSLRGDQGIVSVIQRCTPTLLEKHKGSPDELRTLGMDVAMNVAGFLGFINAVPADAVHYAGKGVKLGTPNRPILWISRKKKGGRCIVIYADLIVKEVPAEEALKLPESDSPKPQAKKPKSDDASR
ncbi:MAG: LolA family protein [Thermoguttaceae bacterium]